MSDSNLRKIIIEPVTRVEGHGKVSLLLDEENNIKQARLHIVEFRGFERFIKGRPYWEVPVLVQRLCGICPVSHHLAAAKAMDGIVGVDKLTPTAEKIRRLMHYGQMFQSHVLHFFHLCSPDLLFGFDADPAIRNVIGVAQKYPELAVQGVMMRKYGQEIIKATAGKKIHGTGAIPGGVNKNISIAERDEFLKDIEQMLKWAKGALKIAKDYTVENLSLAMQFANFDSNHLSLIREDGAMDLYHGNLRAIDKDGNKIFDQVDYNNYVDYIAEEVKSWSYMKFPFIKSIGTENGWYRVGPLARVNACDFIDTPLAEEARKEFMAVTAGKPNNLSLAYHWTRMIETLHSAEKIKELLNDPDLQGKDLVLKGKRREEAVGLIEAPRGTLFHHYKVNKDDQIEMCNLIVSTTHNNVPMNTAVEKVAQTYLSGKPEITEGLLNHIEVAIRAYDPCLSCATHAMGQMPLVVSLFDHKGNLIDKKVKK
ncbi:MAG: Ni/Fe hydrogenase subunit alpha [Candidatus Omnitrophica bacterium]|nr:Ni/Fe hydrogenase subunit alpha [Candidatus Omnitrophota bacterium]MBU1996970.1 Ni/Fe hydrogenase subunit alpha [Candidatus Omnitrophota bacterium]MBU4334396.1 Ni/Fe hydrogenase subunit alpha [Candidatus Omnitrophota bacterium]